MLGARDTLITPLPRREAAQFALLSCAGVAVYCLVYSRFSGYDETIGQALSWGVAMVLPWIAAFEIQKRFRTWRSVTLVLAAAMLASLLLGVALCDRTIDEFEVVRRLPGPMTVALLAAYARLPRTPSKEERSEPALPIASIDYVRAAGNYVEMVTPNGVITRRSSLSQIEQRLRAHGFVRIHRSILVREDAIERIRPEDVILADGTSLRIGKRYRRNLSR